MQKETIIIIGAIIILFIGGFLFLQSRSQKELPTNNTSSEAGSSSAGQQPTLEQSNNQTNSTNLTNSTNSTNQPTPPMIIDKTKKYQAVLKTSVGDITIDLTANKTPITVNNFVSLVKKGLYDKTIFHRVIKGFMIQGGDPKGDGTGGPGYKFDDEKFDGEYTRGTVAMANAGPNTNGSQFFIMHADTPLPKNYVIFGKVSAGLDTVDKIATAPTKSGGEGSTPVDPVVVKSVDIVEK